MDDLFTAVNNENIEEVKNLLANIEDDNLKDTSFMLSWNILLGGNKDIVKLLLGVKCDINNLDLNFINKHLVINEENIGYIIQLSFITDLSKLKNFDYAKFMKYYIELYSYINEVTNRHLTKLILEYI